MSKSEAFNMDCMEGMKQYPDKYFDLAVVDPPYGDASSQSLNVEREREREPQGVEPIRTAIRQIQESGEWITCTAVAARERERESGAARTGKELPTARRFVGLRELEEHGRGSMQKNYCVGCSAEAGIF